MFWFLTYSVLRIRLSSKLAEMAFLGQDTIRKHSTQRYPSLYEVCALLRLFMCIITVQYRSYTINSHTNPHNLASRRLW